jgi:glycosyltransferase involved in cell wall biosynthesis
MESHQKISEDQLKPMTFKEPEKKKLTSLSIIIPAYNEEKAIGAVLDGLCSAPELENAEILVVDDGSTDATSAVVSRFHRARLVQHSTNRGYGAAISTGVNLSSGDTIVWFDADGQHRVEDLVTVAQTLADENLDYCIGSRDNDSYQASERKLGKFILAVAVKLAAGSMIKDFNSGLRGFKREVIQKYLHLMPKGFGASTTTSLIVIERGYIGKEVPIVVRNRIGKSSVNQIRDGFRTLMLVLRIFLLFKPMQFFGGIGLFFILIGAIYGFTKAFMNRQGFPVLAALVIIFGIQSVFFGLLADQISSLRREKFE